MAATRSAGLVLVGVVAFVVAVAGCSRAPETSQPPTGPPAGVTPAITVHAAAILPITGEVATYGKECWNGMQLGCDHANRNSRVKLELTPYDNQAAELLTRQTAIKLADAGKVKVFIGAITSNCTNSIKDIARNAGLPLVTPASTSVTVTSPDNPWVTRICYTDDFQGECLARLAYDNLNARRAAVFVNSQSDYSKGLAESFRQAFLSMGTDAQVVSQVSYDDATISYGPQLKRMRLKDPDVIVLPDYYERVALILKQAREIGITAPFVGSDGWDSPSLYKLAGPAATGNYFLTHFAKDEPSEQVKAFVAEYEARFNESPGALAALGYDAVGVVSDAVNRAVTLDEEGIRDAINSTTGFSGVTGGITIDANHNARKHIVVMKTLEDGAELFATIEPR